MKWNWKICTGIVLLLVTIFTVLSLHLHKGLEETRNFTLQINRYKTRIIMLQTENKMLSTVVQRKKSSPTAIISGTHQSQRSEAVLDEAIPPHNGNDAPISVKGEKLRRRISNQLDEMWYYLSDQLHSLAELTGKPNQTKLGEVLRFYKEINQITQLDLEEYTALDGAQVIRDKMATELSDKVQRRIHKLQHPDDCESARKLVCSLNKSCGYGCQMHHILYCFIVAYYTRRTMILDSTEWDYSLEGWDQYFLPLSSTCVTSIEGVEWGIDHEKHQVS